MYGVCVCICASVATTMTTSPIPEKNERESERKLIIIKNSIFGFMIKYWDIFSMHLLSWFLDSCSIHNGSAKKTTTTRPNPKLKYIVVGWLAGYRCGTLLFNICKICGSKYSHSYLYWICACFWNTDTHKHKCIHAPNVFSMNIFLYGAQI